MSNVEFTSNVELPNGRKGASLIQHSTFNIQHYAFSESGNQFLVLCLEVAQHVLLVQVTAEGIVHLHRALGGAHHGVAWS